MENSILLKAPDARKKSLEGSAARMQSMMMVSGTVMTVNILEPIDMWGFDVNPVIEQITRAEDLTEIVLRINCGGGHADDGAALYNTLRMAAAKGVEVRAEIIGMCASAATVIALGADEIKMSSLSEWMIHRAWVVAFGNANDLREVASRLAQMDEGFVKLYASRSNLSENDVRSMFDEGDSFFTADAAIEAGFVQGILGEDDYKKEPKAKAMSEDAYTSRVAERLNSDPAARKILTKAETPKRQFNTQDLRLMRLEQKIAERGNSTASGKN